MYKESIKNLRKVREKRGISLGQLSKMTGISKSTLQRYETGKTHKVYVNDIIALDSALNYPFLYNKYMEYIKRGGNNGRRIN